MQVEVAFEADKYATPEAFAEDMRLVPPHLSQRVTRKSLDKSIRPTFDLSIDFICIDISSSCPYVFYLSRYLISICLS